MKIISIVGKRLSIWQMTLRFLILFFGPLNFFVDILWLTGEQNKQTLRDKMFGTYVVKRRAQQHYVRAFLLIQSDLQRLFEII